MNRANRIICDQTGKILLQTGETAGDILLHDKITELHCIDIPYGSIDYTKQYIESINLVAKKTIIKDISAILTE